MDWVCRSVAKQRYHLRSSLVIIQCFSSHVSIYTASVHERVVCKGEGVPATCIHIYNCVVASLVALIVLWRHGRVRLGRLPGPGDSTAGVCRCRILLCMYRRQTENHQGVPAGWQEHALAACRCQSCVKVRKRKQFHQHMASLSKIGMEISESLRSTGWIHFWDGFQSDALLLPFLLMANMPFLYWLAFSQTLSLSLTLYIKKK